MTDLVERLRNFNLSICLEAATALEAKDKELAALRAELDEARRAANLGCDAHNGGAHSVMSDGAYKFCTGCGETIKTPSLRERARAAEARAETAERRVAESGASWRETLRIERDSFLHTTRLKEQFKRERDEARAALKPFAHDIPARHPDDQIWTVYVTVSDVRRAMRAIKR